MPASGHTFAQHAVAMTDVGNCPPLTFFFSLPDKFFTVSFFRFSLPIFTFPFFAPAALDFVTIVCLLRRLSSEGIYHHYDAVNAFGWLSFAAVMVSGEW